MTFIEEHNEKYKNFVSFHHRNNYARDLVAIGRNVCIGQNVFIGPFVTIYDDVTIGDDCIIESGAVIGSEGFSTRLVDGRAIRMRNVGGVRIGNGVEIGANTCIDRASLDGVYTTLGDRVLIDNLVHVAHNVVIGNDTRIAPQVCIGGSCSIGSRVWISIGASLREHLTIGDDAEIMMGAVVINSVGTGKKVGGHYATNHELWKAFSKRINAGAFRRLYE
jgi:UDP-3-O-[3-hydroxymyristoyl] glucosamine N-acyltransferase